MKFRAAMRELRDSDSQAVWTAEILSRAQVAAQADMALEIPEYALRIVKAAASVARPAAEETPNAKTWRFLSLEVLFDSLMQPAMMGVRDMGMSHRQVSFQAEDALDYQTSLSRVGCSTLRPTDSKQVDIVNTQLIASSINRTH